MREPQLKSREILKELMDKIEIYLESKSNGLEIKYLKLTKRRSLFIQAKTITVLMLMSHKNKKWRRWLHSATYLIDEKERHFIEKDRISYLSYQE